MPVEIIASDASIPGEGGKTMAAHVARPKATGKYPVVVVIIEAFGLNRHIEDVAERFAREGYVSIAPDFYYREGHKAAAAYADLVSARRLMSSIVDSKYAEDMRRVLDFLREQDYALVSRLGTVGFCMGGRLSYLAACQAPGDVKACVVFYGGRIVTRDRTASAPVPPVEMTSNLEAPVLGFFGDLDAGIPLDDIKELEATLKRLGKSGEFHVYKGAPHGFFCDERGTFRPEAAKDAWQRTLVFFQRHLKAGTPTGSR
ncbi:MAG: dienelactone hydrolase family protein [Dehalococcoidia bacterium]|nr:dienelactone hydrolase family protein [Dehalococcoidia bacterium]